jgi:hypothetical protein
LLPKPEPCPNMVILIAAKDLVDARAFTHRHGDYSLRSE